MKIGLLATVNEYTVDPASLARKVEQLGFESLWVPDHAVMPVHTTTPLPESPPGEGQIPEVYSHMCDPFVAKPDSYRQRTRDARPFLGWPRAVRYRRRMAERGIRDARRRLPASMDADA